MKRDGRSRWLRCRAPAPHPESPLEERSGGALRPDGPPSELQRRGVFDRCCAWHEKQSSRAVWSVSGINPGRGNEHRWLRRWPIPLDRRTGSRPAQGPSVDLGDVACGVVRGDWAAWRRQSVVLQVNILRQSRGFTVAGPSKGPFRNRLKATPKLRDAGDANHAHRGSVKSDMRPFRVLVPTAYTPGSVKL